MKQVYKFIFPVSIYHIAVFEMSLLIHYEISLNQFFQSNFFSSLQKLVITINLNSYNMKKEKCSEKLFKINLQVIFKKPYLMKENRYNREFCFFQ
jgi:hypothetical protein